MITIESTEKTPRIIFDSASKSISIVGICVPESALEFFKQIYPAFEKEFSQSSSFTIDIFLDYFNTSSSKELLSFLFEAKRKEKQQGDVKVIWRYLPNDDEMYEAGEILQEITELTFDFVETERPNEV